MIDVILDNNLDLSIANGDFVVDDAEQQNQELILAAQQGAYRNSPLVGVGITNYLKSSFTVANVDKLRQKIRLQMQYDGYQTVNVQINSFMDIELQAER